MEAYIYTYISKKELGDVLKAFSDCMSLPVRLLDPNGDLLMSCGPETQYCRLFESVLPEGQSCAAMHSSASKSASELGEAYIFSCHGNLTHIIYPLVSKDVLLGSVLVGPFIMDKPDSLLLIDLSKHFDIPTETLLELAEQINGVKVISPPTVTQMSKLLSYVFNGLLTDGLQLLIMNRERLSQQSRINESIQRYKSYDAESAPSPYPYEKEKELLIRVKTGNTGAAKMILNDLLGYTLFAEGNDLANIRPRALELASLLSRAAIEGGAPTDSILRINNEFIKRLEESDMSMEDICYKLQEITEVFTESMFGKSSKSSETIKKAIQFIAQNYSADITLERVAQHVGLNASYLSTYFKQSCGSSFKEYLNLVRIEEAKRLLANTDYTILDIALAIGYENQSYFSKVFKKYTGITPKQYR